MSNNRKHVAIRVHGKVQGVFFRASAQEKAEELGLTGFVQNEPDGTVYLEAEGDVEALQALEAWLHIGPRRARVEHLEVRKKDELQGFEKFEQRR
ncbi:acylphosphatase [Pontibacter roseus]|uniref:acylphosphatase n=1 Tax=Pontibacter roseus TaxID=336989 RepID=UPI00035CF7DA|nr:acylphosphatase [Pontibacter roseus]